MSLKVQFSVFWHKSKRTGVVLTEDMPVVDITGAFKFILDHKSSTGEPCGLVWQDHHVELEEIMPLLIDDIVEEQDKDIEKLTDCCLELRKDLDGERVHREITQSQLRDEIAKRVECVNAIATALSRTEDNMEMMSADMLGIRNKMNAIEAQNKGITDAMPILGRKKRTLRKDP